MQFELEQAIEILGQTPSALRAMLGNLSEEWTHGGSREDWAPYDIVGHLIHAEHTNWIPRAKVILAQDGSTFEPFERYAQFENSKDKTLHELLEDFESARSESLMRLEALEITPEKLALKAAHSDLGEVTLAQLLSTWAVHDLGHIRQIVVFMAKKYSDAVGPWKEYLSILK
jgi:hypothetical protein